MGVNPRDGVSYIDGCSQHFVVSDTLFKVPSK